MAASIHSQVFGLPLPLGTDVVARQDLLTIGQNLEERAMAITIAMAAIVGNTLNIISAVRRDGDNYDVQFIAPERYMAGRVLVIDEDGMEGLFLIDGGLAKSGAWGNGVPVLITRRGNRAYLMNSGGVESAGAMMKSGGEFTGNALAYSDDRVGDGLRNAQILGANRLPLPEEEKTSYLRYVRRP